MPPLVRALIVDDERAARLRLARLLAPDDRVDVVGEAADGAAMLSQVRGHRPDLVFLDVHMPGLDGVTALEQLPPDERPSVIFVTAHAQYAVQAFAVRAIDYLLKPVRADRLTEAIDRAVMPMVGADARAAPHPAGARASAAHPGDVTPRRPYLTRVLLPGSDPMQVVDTRDIEYVAANGNYVTLRVRDRDIVLRQTMQRLHERLDPAQFVRIHRKYIVNLSSVSAVSAWFGGEYVIRTRSGADLRLSRSYRDDFFERIDPTR